MKEQANNRRSRWGNRDNDQRAGESYSASPLSICCNGRRTTLYTPDLPAQTIVPVFQEGGAEAFELGWYWTSTEYAPDPGYAYVQDFGGGDQYGSLRKVNQYRARAVRMIKL